MKLWLSLIGISALTVATPILAQDANVEGRVTRLEKEMRAVQRQVFPNGAAKFFEPEIGTEGPVKTVSAPSESIVSGLIARVDALESQLAMLTGQVEQQGNDMRSIMARLKSVETGLKAQADAVATSGPPADQLITAASTQTKTTPKADAARVAAVAAIEKPATGDAFEDDYIYGYRLWEAKFFPEAQVQLQETVNKYPKHVRASFARNLLGRAWLDDDKPATAVKIFYDNYKLDDRGARAPESLYFLGVALTELKKTTEACEALGQLAIAYPGEAEGRLADRIASARTRAKCK